MDPRPAKRQRKLAVSSSDSEPDSQPGEDNAALSLSTDPTAAIGVPESVHSGYSNSQSAANPRSLSLRSSRPKPAPRAPSRTHTTHRAASSSASPEKRRYGKPLATDTAATKSLHSFFQPATEEQRWSQKFEARHAALDPVREKVDDSDDLIEDDYDSYDELFTKHFADRALNVREDAKPSQKRRGPLSRSSSMNSDRSRKLTSSKAFFMPYSSSVGVRGRGSLEEVYREDRRPWAQRFPPSNLDELAVHKRKVADVRGWLENVFTGRDRRRLLVLRGPAGCGKTTTISLLSRALGFDVLEWKNPAVSDFGEKGYTSVGAQFEEFLGRSHEFGGLDLDTGVDTAAGEDNPIPSQRRILLIEEFPTIMSRTSSSLSAFRSSFQQYLAASMQSLSNSSFGNDPAGQTSSPIVIIVSETLLNSASSVLDNLTVYRLLGPGLYNHPGTTIIDFNSIAPTFMHKALKLVLEKESNQSRRSRVPGQAALQTISEIGDIRSAISSLEFLCVKGDDAGAWGGNLSTKAKKPRDSAALTQMEKESLKMVTQREASLGIFHAVGKIVYNKRDDPSLTEAVQLPPPPDHLRHHSRPKVSQVSVNGLVDETGTDIQTFVCALHENYAPSCHDSDILCAEGRGFRGSRAGARINTNKFNAGVDRLRQHEISYQVAARGLLFALPHPVKRSLRAINGHSHAGDAHKMLYPNSVRLWRETEEIDGLVDLWATRLLSPSTRQNRPHSKKPWSAKASGTSHAEQGDSSNMGTMPVTMLSREDMLLYQLPYMTKIQRHDIGSRELQRITGFDGIAPQADADNVDGSDDLLDIPDFPLSVKSRPPKSYGNGKPFGTQIPSLVEDAEAKLILSDDDIEDD